MLEVLDILRPFLDLYKVDLKGFREAFYKQHTGGELKPVLDTLRRLRKHGVWTEIVVLLIPTLNDSVAEVRDLARFVRDDLGAEVPSTSRGSTRRTASRTSRRPVATLERAREVALAEGLAFAYVGNVPGHPGESTYCPGCKGRLIRRVGMATVENRLKKGACPDCGRAIPGVWS